MAHDVIFGFLKPDGATHQRRNIILRAYLKRGFPAVYTLTPIRLTPEMVQELYGERYKALRDTGRANIRTFSALIGYLTSNDVIPFFALGDHAEAKELAHMIRAHMGSNDPVRNLLHIADPDQIDVECRVLDLAEKLEGFRLAVPHILRHPVTAPPAPDDPVETLTDSSHFFARPHLTAH